MRIVSRQEIETALKHVDLLKEIEAGFIAYSQGKSVVPPVGELLFENPPGEIHIKSGYLRNDDICVIKIASGFYKNPSLGLPSSNGLMLIFSQKTGEPLALLNDGGLLTDLRTAAAGAVAARCLAPSTIQRIGIFGCGIQARLQLSFLKQTTSCRDAIIWGRNENKLKSFCDEMENEGFQLRHTLSAEEVASTANLIVTTTPSTKPLLLADWIRPGTHITAVGSDAPHKQELDSAILRYANVIVADSIAQSRERGEISHALRDRVIAEEKICELGDVLCGTSPGRTNADEITVADLTGVAVQDIQIAKAVYSGLPAES